MNRAAMVLVMVADPINRPDRSHGVRTTIHRCPASRRRATPSPPSPAGASGKEAVTTDYTSPLGPMSTETTDVSLNVRIR